MKMKNKKHTDKTSAQPWHKGKIEAFIRDVATGKYGLDVDAIIDRATELNNSGTAASAALAEVLAERERQITEEGFSAAKDDRHTRGELTRAATAYLTGEDSDWPAKWDKDLFKPTCYTRNIVIAAALLLAELERINRQTQRDVDTYVGTPIDGAEGGEK